jgi:hypothetical protein
MSTDSDLRMPVPYSKAMIAASRTPCGRGSAAHIHQLADQAAPQVAPWRQAVPWPV